MIGGVPEHFNLPWHLSIEAGEFEEAGIKLNWKDFHGGTGAMTKALRAGELDIAVALTEGVVSEIIKGSPTRILQFYVDSPLIWGIHVNYKSEFETVNDLRAKRYAISRFGSGSHLISIVNAQQRGWSAAAQQFEVVGNLEGALEALTNGTADALLWEKFMTKPFVDRRKVRRIGVCTPPWPCFVIVAREDKLAQHPEAIKRICAIILKAGADFSQRKDAVELVAKNYGLQPEDAAEWFAHTEWASTSAIEKVKLNNVMNSLKEIGIIEEARDPIDLCWSETELI